MKNSLTGIMVFLLLVAPLSSVAAEHKPCKVHRSDKCPVCGMFVAKYPDFVTVAQLGNGSCLFFDGTKDLFKFLLSPATYQPGTKSADIESIRVKDYYTTMFIGGFTAFYVIGSDVFGPMGKELIPFGKEADAQEFLRDHKGKKILRYKDITPAILKDLDH